MDILSYQLQKYDSCAIMNSEINKAEKIEALVITLQVFNNHPLINELRTMEFLFEYEVYMFFGYMLSLYNDAINDIVEESCHRLHKSYKDSEALSQRLWTYYDNFNLHFTELEFGFINNAIDFTWRETNYTTLCYLNTGTLTMIFNYRYACCMNGLPRSFLLRCLVDEVQYPYNVILRDILRMMSKKTY